MSSSSVVEQELNTLRRGPRPLPVFVGMAGMLAASEAEQRAMIEGLKLYQAHPFRRSELERDVLWQSGCVTLRHIPAQGQHHLLLIPSMINRSIILDLLPERSFARWLAAQGIDVHILDWGDPAHDPGQQNIDNVLLEKLMPCLSFLKKKYGSYDALGYCMGGTLLAGAVQLKPPGLNKVIYLASPWDFHAGNRQLQQQVVMGTASALQMTEAGRALPSHWVQSVFAAVNAQRNIHKFADFAKLEQDSDQARLFVALEDWLNDGVDLPAALARTCVVDWYGQNKPVQGGWQIGGQVVDPAATVNPVLVVASSTDRLVPEESSHALARLIPGAALLQSQCGHIGMMSSRRAEADVWQPLYDWIVA